MFATGLSLKRARESREKKEKEKRDTSVSFFESLAIGIPTTISTVLVYPPFVGYATNTPFYANFGMHMARSIPTLSLTLAFKSTFQSKVFGEPDPHDEKLFFKSFLSGGFGGALTNLLLYSGENVRFRMKADDFAQMHFGGQQQFTSFKHCFKQTLASEGYSGLYRGILPSTIGMFAFRGAFFGIYDAAKPKLFGEEEDALLANLALGYLTAIAADIIGRPFFHVATQPLLHLRAPVPYKNGLDYLSMTVKTEGYKALFEGTQGSMVRAVFGACILAGYDYLKVAYLDYREGKPVQLFGWAMVYEDEDE